MRKRLIAAAYADLVAYFGGGLILLAGALGIAEIIVHEYQVFGPIGVGLLGLALVLVGWGIATACREWGK